MTGTVDRIEFTNGGLGNQYTTIDGTRYMTWWDAQELPIRVGARVEYEVADWRHSVNGAEVEGRKAFIKRVLG